MTEEERSKIVESLNKMSPNLKCPICGHDKFGLVDGFFRNTVQPTPEFHQLSGQGIPVIVIICDNCGFISQHAAGKFGFLKKVEGK